MLTIIIIIIVHQSQSRSSLNDFCRKYDPPYGCVRTSISSRFFHQIVDFSTKSLFLVAFITRIVLRESFNDLILVTERHFSLTRTRDFI